MKYEFLIESYASERLKVLSIWSEFKDEDLMVRLTRPIPADAQHPTVRPRRRKISLASRRRESGDGTTNRS